MNGNKVVRNKMFALNTNLQFGKEKFPRHNCDHLRNKKQKTFGKLLNQSRKKKYPSKNIARKCPSYYKDNGVRRNTILLSLLHNN